jgi:hypothetical protein
MRDNQLSPFIGEPQPANRRRGVEDGRGDGHLLGLRAGGAAAARADYRLFERLPTA